MRTCIIQTNNAPESLIRFTEVKCFFDYKNEWLGFFDKVIITEDADSVQEHGWKINAGQYITSKIRNANENKFDLDLRTSDIPIEFDPNNWSEVQEMQQYRGKKQEYIFRNYMVMILKSRKKMIYFSNNESLPKVRNYRDFRHTCNLHDNYMLITGYTLRHGDSPYFLWRKNLQCTFASRQIDQKLLMKFFIVLFRC